MTPEQQHPEMGYWIETNKEKAAEKLGGQERIDNWKSGVITYDQLINGHGNIATLEKLRKI